ncbi:hypothetical protein [Desulfovibrio psychrotolerans]|uniref:Uncharacterized protein n=1 Tax=Desulfovibrio psychrotolerans TaxID=415242 RepID=A0A7J0BVT5_9BACT|nr:hypothetical protein [Desulfovibrio psychrotolerans]GFM37819.1 hypothetical protein DSM19430T_25030 [Desulfovibrio psychrotolerans]
MLREGCVSAAVTDVRTVREWALRAVILAFLLMPGMGVAQTGQGGQAGQDPVAAVDSVLDSVDEALGRAERAREVYDRAKRVGSPEGEVRRAEEAWRNAERDVRSSNARLHEARIASIAHAAGVPQERVRSMRASGKGWGAICNELGVPPSVLGKGGKGKSDAPDKGDKRGKPDKPGKPGKNDKAGMTGMESSPAAAEEDGRGGKPEAAGKPGKAGKPEKSGKSGKSD